MLHSWLRKLAVSIAVLMVLLVTGARPVAGAIGGTAHDLSGKYGSSEICIYCHTPHNSDITVTDAPLWNHKVTTATYQMYSSPTLNATMTTPGTSSKLCLSCHDGTVAIDAYGGSAGTTNMTGVAKVGTDLRNDHPIGFTYDSGLATADGGLTTPQDASWVDVAHKVPLFSSKLECASCHQVHDNAFDPFLRISNNGSALCLKCHTK